MCEPSQLVSNKSSRATYVDAEGSQHARVLGVVCDLHERREGQRLVGEALPEVVGDEDPRALTAGHYRGEDHLQNQGRGKNQSEWTRKASALPPTPTQRR